MAEIEYKDDSLAQPLDAGALIASLYEAIGRRFPVSITLTQDRKKVQSLRYVDTWKEGMGERYTTHSLTEVDKAKIAEWVAANLPNLKS